MIAVPSQGNTDVDDAIHLFRPAKPIESHHLKQDEFMNHAEKALQLGEKVFVSGGMKLSKG